MSALSAILLGVQIVALAAAVAFGVDAFLLSRYTDRLNQYAASLRRIRLGILSGTLPVDTPRPHYPIAPRLLTNLGRRWK